MGKQQNIGLIQQISTSLRTRTACRRQRLRQRQGKEIPHPRTQLLAHCVRQAMPDLFALSVPAMKASGVRVEFGCTSNKSIMQYCGVFFLFVSPLWQFIATNT